MRCACVLILCLSVARLAAADGEWVRSVDVTMESKHVRRGIERAEAGVRPAAHLTDGSWRVGASLNLPFAHARDHELAVVTGYTHALDSGAELGFQATQFLFGGAERGHPTQSLEVTIAFSLPLGPGRAALSLTRDVERRADIGELSYAGEYALKSWGAFLNYRFYAGSVSAEDVLPRLAQPSPIADSYAYHGVDLTLPYRVGGQTVLTAGAHYAGTNGARPFWSPNKASTGAKVWLSLAASYEF